MSHGPRAPFFPGEVVTSCGIYQCNGEYIARSKYTCCPECGCSEAEVEEFGSNDRDVIRACLRSIRPTRTP